VAGRGDPSARHAAVQGGILCTATIIIAVNLIVDVLYGVINPRIRHS
jgi:dipeptide transport system permease protein